MLNGTDPLVTIAGHSGAQGDLQPRREVRGEQPPRLDMELLIQQLLSQDGALQRELSEVRQGSASGSTVSGEGRAEGRGSRRSSRSGSEALKKGKGQGN